MNTVSSNDLDALLKSEPALWRGRDQHNEYASVPTGFPQLDNVLPSGGWAIGCLTELLPEQLGIGELSILLPGLQQVTSENQWAAFVNPPYVPYPPALANARINLERLLIVNTENDNDTLWATEQLLRAGIFAAVVGWVNRTTAQKQRRLQLAAELGKTWATVYRPARAQQEHSPAAYRIVLAAQTDNTNQLSLNIIKSRGGKQRSVHINPSQFDHSQGAEWPVMSPDTPLAEHAQINPVAISPVATMPIATNSVAANPGTTSSATTNSVATRPS